MTDAFEDAFTRTVGAEGDFSDDPADSGGKTRFGITEAVARANDYTGPMRELPFETARTIARAQYWNLLRLDDVARESPAIAAELFDTGYNMGIDDAGLFLQRALNALNRRGADYPDLRADGLVGPMTISAFRAYLKRRGREGELVLLKALNGLQCAGYIELAEAREKDERFVFGWIKNRVELETAQSRGA